ncbi:MAG: 23S rRNA (adenine(2030)-N(6))-methyltransferase RlmJ [Alphaproteobacteria bacterium]|nr:MAG: 23S rRNA (adenine(2030)-N(6))-methyltransferase RlmJ [Alphaproteobacteria bacterium]
MNYRHGFHAGSTADVFKHVALCLVLSCLARKDAPFLVLDTHAGAGLYDLESSQAQRSADAESGVLRLISSGPLPASFDSYLQGLKAANGGQDALRHYPGSPSLIRGMLRANDQLIAIEKHPQEAAHLRECMGHDRRVRVLEQDGYAALASCLPPPQRRGLVMIDPPFEAADEWENILRGLSQALRRFGHGIYMVWYPIKDRMAAWSFHEKAMELAPKRPILVAEHFTHSPDRIDRLNGSGLLFINAPWSLAQTLSDEVLPLLNERFSEDTSASHVTTLRAEA